MYICIHIIINNILCYILNIYTIKYVHIYSLLIMMTIHYNIHKYVVLN